MADEEKSNDSSSEDSSKDKFSDEEIEKILKQKISSGYSKEEIEKIISSAVPVYEASRVDLSKNRPKHTNTDDFIYDYATEYFGYPTVYFEVNDQPLRILLGSNIKPDIEIAETRMHSGFETNDKTAVKHLYFQGDAGLTIECTAIVRTDDKYVGAKVGDIDYTADTTVASVLMDWGKSFQTCKLITDDPVINKNYYRLKAPEFEHVLPNLYKVKLTFVEDTYNFNTGMQTENAMSNVNNVIKTGTGSTGYYDSSGLNWDSKIQGFNQGLPSDSTFVKQLKGCKPLSKTCSCVSYKKASCNTKYVQCVWYYQKALKQMGYYLDGRHDGLFCYLTKRAVTQFQKDYKLTVNGSFDEQTEKKIIEKIQKMEK